MAFTTLRYPLFIPVQYRIHLKICNSSKGWKKYLLLISVPHLIFCYRLCLQGTFEHLTLLIHLVEYIHRAGVI